MREPAALDDQDVTRWWPALVVAVVAVVVVTFVLSYHGLYEFGTRLAFLPRALAVAVPVGIDVFSLCALFATFLCRDAHWRVRFYCWLVFGTTVAVSVAGNAIYAVWAVEQRAAAVGVAARDVVWSYREYSAVGGAALWPALAAGALHLLIITRRHMATRSAKIMDLGGAQVSEVERQQAQAIIRVAEGDTCAAIADDMGLPVRTVQRWTAELRAAMAPRVNGSRPKVTVGGAR